MCPCPAGPLCGVRAAWHAWCGAAGFWVPPRTAGATAACPPPWPAAARPSLLPGVEERVVPPTRRGGAVQGAPSCASFCRRFGGAVGPAGRFPRTRGGTRWLSAAPVSSGLRPPGLVQALFADIGSGEWWWRSPEPVRWVAVRFLRSPGLLVSTSACPSLVANFHLLGVSKPALALAVPRPRLAGQRSGCQSWHGFGDGQCARAHN